MANNRIAIETRNDAIKNILNGQTSVREVAEALGVTPRCVYHWLKAHDQKDKTSSPLAAPAPVAVVEQPASFYLAPAKYPNEDQVRSSVRQRAIVVVNEPRIMPETGVRSFAQQLKNIHEKVSASLVNSKGSVGIVLRRILQPNHRYSAGQIEAIAIVLASFAKLFFMTNANKKVPVYFLHDAGHHTMEEVLVRLVQEQLQGVGYAMGSDLITIPSVSGLTTLVVGNSTKIYTRAETVSDADLDRAHGDLRLRAAQRGYPAVISVVPTGSLRSTVTKGFNLSPGSMHDHRKAPDVRNTSMVILQSVGGNDILEIETRESIYPLPTNFPHLEAMIQLQNNPT